MSNPENGRAADVLFGLIERGGSDLAQRNDALRLALRNLLDDCLAASPQSMLDPVDYRSLQRMAGALSDAGLMASFLLDLMRPYSDGELKLELSRRRSGPLVDWQERARDKRAAIGAARWVARLELAGRPTEAAVSLVAEKTGLTRSEIYWGRRARKKGLDFRIFERWWDPVSGFPRQP